MPRENGAIITLHHNPKNRKYRVGAHESRTFLFVFDKDSPAATIHVTIENRGVAEMFLWIIGRGNAAIPITVRLDHRGANAKSTAKIRAVLKDASTNIFRGEALIHKGAHDAESFLEYRALLFDSAHATATPALEIEEHPIRAGHAAAIGRIDQEQLFYLQSRGLTPKQATQLITQGFFAQLIEAINDPKQKKKVTNLLNP